MVRRAARPRDVWSAAAIIAATITALYPYYVVHDTALQETSLYTFVTALAVLLLLRARRSGSGVMARCACLTLGAAVLTRADPAPFAHAKTRNELSTVLVSRHASTARLAQSMIATR
jgi:hypothetical protein